mmetsp:Transcript_62021/g.108133  ORF Transcript_62021/g.108133 Transcript_62021/m.108133 type:complete len:196 (+) Transcript_62021:2-589(+)
MHLLLRSWWGRGCLKAGGIGNGTVLRHARGDVMATLRDIAGGNIDDVGSLPDALQLVQERINMLVTELCVAVPELNGFVKCQPPMFAVYPGGGSRYVRHYDYGNGPDPFVSARKQKRLLTLILYLNPFWLQEHGGQLRLYPEQVDANQAADDDAAACSKAVDVEPAHGRLLAFLCNNRNPHEVLAAWRPRLAVTW